MKLNFIFFISALLLIGIVHTSYAAMPLLQEGKQTVYQRIVTHPGAKLYAGSEPGAEVIMESVPTFTVMYIYDRKGDRLQVGTGSGGADGWIDKSQITEWPHAITLLFTDRTGRDPVLFFRDHDTLEKICNLEDVSAALDSLKTHVAENKQDLPSDYPVVATEPLNAAVSENNFYLMPVLSMDEQFVEQGGPRLIEVASINPGQGAASGPASKDAEFRTGFVFVIDTTISMRKYIDQTLKLIRGLYDELEKSPYADNMAFAVVAFRNSLEKTPDIGYTAKVISDFTTVRDRKKLESALASVKEAPVSSHEINEDSFAGIKEAVDKLSWDKYGSRVMLMITDAGPLAAEDPASSTGLTPESLAEYLRNNRIYLTALHVKNPRTPADVHEYAQNAYRTLTRQSDNTSSYIQLDAPTPQKGAQVFNNVGRVLAQTYADVVSATAQGKPLERPDMESVRKGTLSPEEAARKIAQSTGYAMQLQFLGNSGQVAAPQLVSAWITDADPGHTASTPADAPVMAVEPAVLMTKGQLSNLYKQLKLVLEASEKAFLEGDADIFDQISSAAAQMSRDPNQFTLNPDKNLAENGLLDEILEGLPYKSTIGNLTREDWESMSTGQRDIFIKRIKNLLERYEAFDKDSSNWESFGAKDPNDSVFRVPLSLLP